jgi:uncharacterized membrane protein YfcA
MSGTTLRRRMTAEVQFWVLMAVVTLATSIVSGVLGMVGGLLLLAALLLRLPPTVAIPVHGVIQFVSNASRAWFLREHVRARVVIPFVVPLLPAGALGLSLLGRLDPGIGKMLIGCFVLVVTWLPARGEARDITKDSDPARLSAARRDAKLLLGGALVGFFSTLVGATGPLIGPFIVGLELSPQGMVGTMAACQVFQHGIKVGVFGLSGFDVRAQLVPASLLSVCAIFGSALGTRFLDRVDRARFDRVVKIVLTLLSFELIAEGVRTLT